MSDGSGPRKSRFWRRFLLWIIGPLVVLAIGCVALIRNPPQSLLLDALAKEFRKQTGMTPTQFRQQKSSSSVHNRHHNSS